MKNVFQYARADFFKISEDIIPEVRTMAFIPAKDKDNPPDNFKLRFFTSSKLSTGFWFLDLPFYKAVKLAEKEFLFAYKIGKQWKVKSFNKINQEVIEVEQEAIPDDFSKLSMKLPYFTEKTSYVETCYPIINKKDIPLTPRARHIINVSKKNLDILLGTTEEELLSPKPLKRGLIILLICSRAYNTIEYIYESYSEKTIAENLDILDFDFISMNRKLSESFVQKHIHKLDMAKLLRSNHFSEDFILANANILPIEIALRHQKLSKAAIEELKNRFDN